MSNKLKSSLPDSNQQEPDKSDNQSEIIPKQKKKNLSSINLKRRAFIGTATVTAIATGVIGTKHLMASKTAAAVAADADPTCSISIPESPCVEHGCDIGPLTPRERAEKSFSIRAKAAQYEAQKPIPAHPCNNDETAVPNFAAMYTKGLPHNEIGEVDPNAYNKLLGALKTGLPSDFNLIPLGCSGVSCSPASLSASEQMEIGGPERFAAENNTDESRRVQRRLVNPQSALAFDLEGVDSHQAVSRPSPFIGNCPIAFPPAPSFSSEEEIGEIAENYWMALARDIPFIEYESNTFIKEAASDLSKYSVFKGPKESIRLRNTCVVTPQTIFRGITRSRPFDPLARCDDPQGIDDLKGPYISQFLVRPIPFGAQCINPRIQTVKTIAQGGTDYMIKFGEWLDVQRGCTPSQGDRFDGFRLIRNGRDLGQYVHIDVLFQAYFNACLILLTPPAPPSLTTPTDCNVCTGGGLGAPFDDGNPYNCSNSRTEIGFATFGGPHLKTLLAEVATRALKAVWYQKWSVHRRLRPEAFAGRIHIHKQGIRSYPFNSAEFPKLEPLLRLIKDHNSRLGEASYLLPMAFPEGSPLHPAYGSGHAVVAGACTTILKAWFKESTPIANPVQPNAEGTELIPYTGADANQLTVGSELNKLVSNIGIGRNFAGVHWRSDYAESIYLGEAIAISLLADMSLTYNETQEGFFKGFSLTKFDGTTITVGGSLNG